MLPTGVPAGLHAAVGLVHLIGAIGEVGMVLLTQVRRIADLRQLIKALSLITLKMKLALQNMAKCHETS